MPNRKIRIKSAALSLAWRALVVSLCLLVLPLLVHSFFLYRADDQHNRADVMAAIELTAAAQKALIEERIALQRGVLAPLSLDQEALFECLGIQKVLVDPDFPDSFVLASPEEGAFFVGKRLEGELALVIPTCFDALFSNLMELEPEPLPISSALVDQEGGVLVGSKTPSDLFTQLSIEGTDYFLFVSAPLSAVEALDQTDYVHHFLSLLFLIAAVGGGIVWLVTRRIAKPLGSLCKTMEKVGQGAVHARYVPDRMGFEINALGMQFNDTLDHLLSQQKEVEQERIARERLAEELKIGRQIQMSLLPKHLPDLQGVELAQGFLPAKEVGGDFYDLFTLPSGKILIAIADTAGKGISACLYSLGLRSMLRTLADSGNSLSQIVLRANELFYKDTHHSGMFVTLWIALYDPEKKELEYCSQGHPPALLVQEGKIGELKTQGIAIGAQIYDAVPTRRLILPPGSLLLLYTDGILEAHGPNQTIFGAHRLREFLLQSETLPVVKIADGLLKEVERFSENIPQHDDITMVVMRIPHNKP